jgi:prephenate dehydrogenase
MTTELRSLAIVGTGLIGASAGLAAKRAGVAHVSGWDADAEHLGLAREGGALDATSTSLEAALAGADLAIVAVPVASLPDQVARTLAAAPDAVTVTDVGSTKAPVCAAAGDDPRFIGGHPICGSETRGPGRATADLFDGATWFLTPLAATDPDRFRLLHGFVASLGARPVAIDPSAHDRLVAVTSHLPHLLANALINQAGAARVDGHDPLAAAGGSLRDMTRIAGANPSVWVDIFLDNRAALLAALGEHRRLIDELEAALADGDEPALARSIAEASDNRRRMLETAYADPGELQRLRVHIPDRPGVLANVFQAFGVERINVADFTMEHMSPDRGGTLTILVAGEAEAERARALLESHGYGVLVAPVLEA